MLRGFLLAFREGFGAGVSVAFGMVRDDKKSKGLLVIMLCAGRYAAESLDDERAGLLTYVREVLGSRRAVSHGRSRCWSVEQHDVAHDRGTQLVEDG